MFSFYWHDYETFGTSPSLDRPSQFAGQRTNADLEPVGEPLIIYCQPPADYLPHPEACLVTGITPQQARDKGLIESEFAKEIEAEFGKPGTCGVGYNSIRFDDEFTRHLLYRNLYDPYQREYRNGNSRWDIIDVTRLAYALRPDGIEWPVLDGKPSFRLEVLTEANGISHEAAHDALSDVHATIAFAKLLKDNQPKLWDYALSLRSKHEVAKHLDIKNRKPMLHISSRYPAERGCAALAVPLAVHPQNKNSIIVWDLAADPQALLNDDAETLRERLYTATDQLEAGVERPALKEVHLNKSPMVMTAKLVDDAVAGRLGIDRDVCQKHLQVLQSAPSLSSKLQEIYSPRDRDFGSDPEQNLYGSFIGDKDKNKLEQARLMMPAQLAETTFSFADQRLPEMLFRYRARNYPETLNKSEALDWREHCRQRLSEDALPGALDLSTLRSRIAKLVVEQASSEKRAVLDALLTYAEELEVSLQG